MNETLQKLKQAGWEVNCYQFRHPRNSTALLPVPRIKKEKLVANSQGGFTLVTARSPQGRTYYATAQCCRKDNFSHKRGFEIGLERLKAELCEHNLL